MSEELEIANAEVVLGIETEKFLETNLGQYVVGCSDQDMKDALHHLLEVNPYDFHTLGELQSKISELQQNVHIARKVQSFFSDAIIRGSQAEEILQNNED